MDSPTKKKHYTESKPLRLFKKIDVFSKPIQLQFDTKEDYHTYCGAFMTLVLVIISIIYGCIQVYNFLIVKNPSIVQGQQLLGDQTIYLGNNNFTLIVGLRANNKSIFNDPTVFSIEAIGRQSSLIELPDGTFQVYKYNNTLITKQCDPNISLLKGTFLTKEARSLICIETPTTVRLAGEFQTDQFDYISIKAIRCQNSTNTTCRSDIEIEKILAGSMFQVYFTNYIIDFSNKDNQLFREIFADVHATYSRDTAKELSVFFEPVTVKTQILDLLPLNEEQTYIYSDSSEITEPQDQGEIFQVVFRLTGTQTVYNLYNVNIFFIMSQLGGLWNFLIMFGGLLIYPFRDFSRKLSIINRIFLFESPKKFQPELLQPEQELDIDKFPKLRVSPFEYLTFFLPWRYCHLMTEQKINQIEYAAQQVWDKLDIVYLLKKLDQLDKMISITIPKEKQKSIHQLTKKVIHLDVVPQPSRQRLIRRKLNKKKTRIAPIGDSESLFSDDSHFQEGLRKTMVDTENIYERDSRKSSILDTNIRSPSSEIQMSQMMLQKTGDKFEQPL